MVRHYFAAMICSSFLGVLMFAPNVLPQQQSQAPNSRVAQEEEIRLAAFLYLFDIGTGPDPDYSFYCLSVDSSGLAELPDPPDSLMKRFPRIHRTLRKFSECELVKGPKGQIKAVRDKKSGKPAWLISLDKLVWVSDHEVRMGALRYCSDALCMWASVLQAKFQDGKWKVSIAPGAFTLVS